MDVTEAAIRALVDRRVGEAPVTSVYLNTDGARYPKSADYEARLDGLLREARKSASGLSEHERAAVESDIEAISRWVRGEFERGDVRGLAVFAQGGEIFETVQSAVGVRNVARVAERPYVVPLEALLGRHHHIALALIERQQARIFRYRMGRAEEYQGLASEVHGQHRQGGWSQLRYQRAIEHDVLHHMRDAAEILLKAHEQDAFDALIVAGPQPEAAEFSRNLHPYLQNVLHGETLNLQQEVSAHDLMEHFHAIEQTLVSARRSELLQRLAAGQGQAEKTARGIRHVLEAINSKRVEVLFVVEGAGEPGFRSASGPLALHRDEAAAYGEPVEPVDDLVDEIIEHAVRAGAHIELFRDEARLDGQPVAALLRF